MLYIVFTKCCQFDVIHWQTVSYYAGSNKNIVNLVNDEKWYKDCNKRRKCNNRQTFLSYRFNFRQLMYKVTNILEALLNLGHLSNLFLIYWIYNWQAPYQDRHVVLIAKRLNLVVSQHWLFKTRIQEISPL